MIMRAIHNQCLWAFPAPDWPRRRVENDLIGGRLVDEQLKDDLRSTPTGGLRPLLGSDRPQAWGRNRLGDLLTVVWSIAYGQCSFVRWVRSV